MQDAGPRTGPGETQIEYPYTETGEKPWEVTRRRRVAGAGANDGKRLARNGDEALGGLPLQ